MSVPTIINLVIGDGQVATTATQISKGAGDHARRLNFKFCNTGTQDETLILTLSRNGGTPRRIKRVVLSANEEFRLSGYPVNSTDSLLAQTTDANAVDYTISIAGDNAVENEETYDDSGRLRTAPYIIEQLDAITS